jgi:hypothetical protein
MKEPKYITRLRDYANDTSHDEPCEHGHFHCASRHGGKCANEAMANVNGYEEAAGLALTDWT